MASENIYQFWRRRFGDDTSAESHPRKESAVDPICMYERIDRQMAEREAKILAQTESMFAFQTARINAVRERLGLPIHQDPPFSPQPPAGPRHSKNDTFRTQRHQWCLTRQAEEVYYGSNGSSSSSGSISPVDSHTPTELRAIPFLRSPDVASPPLTLPFPLPPLPPVAKLPRRRVCKLPVLRMSPGGAEKVIGGYKLQTAKGQVENIQKGLENIQHNSVVHLPRPPAAPRGIPAVTPVTPAPPSKPAPAGKRGTRPGMSLQPAKTVKRGTNTGNRCNLQTDDNKSKNNLEELQPLSNPVEDLSHCFELLSSKDWIKKTEGLRCIQALAQHHSDTLMVKLHDVCLAVIEEVKNLRSSVACVAIDTMAFLYVYLQRDMDAQAERTGCALLQKLAQSNASVFIQQRANLALEALVQNCSPRRVLPALVNGGLSHLSAEVRTGTAEQLHLLADILGADAIFSASKSFTKSFLTAVAKMSLDAAAKVRPHGHAILQELSLHKDFSKLWMNVIARKDVRLLARILRAANKAY